MTEDPIASAPPGAETPERAAWPAPPGEPPVLPGESDVRHLLAQLGRFGALLAALWLALAAIHEGLPYIRPGAVLIYQAKQRWLRSEQVFASGARARVAVFGDSRILSGFKPDLFDALNAGESSSVNLALPDSERFLDELTALCARGDTPTHVLLTVAWPDDPAARFDPFRSPFDDRRTLETLVPFRDLPRNLTLFLLRSTTRGGPRAYYRSGEEVIEGMLAARGWYFIEDQSHYPGHRLPDGFELESDTPEAIRERRLDPAAPALARLLALADEFELEVVYVPVFFRQGQYATPPDPNPEAVAAVAGARRVRVLGPDYWLLPNRLFSDPVHLNPEGAEAYTRRLWELVAPAMRPSGAPAGGAGGAR